MAWKKLVQKAHGSREKKLKAVLVQSSWEPGANAGASSRLFHRRRDCYNGSRQLELGRGLREPNNKWRTSARQMVKKAKILA